MTTMREFGETALRDLCRATNLTDLEPQALNGYRTLTESWGDRRVDQPPLWSTLTSDSTPLELSVLLTDGPIALRATVEALAEPANPATYWAAAQHLTTRLTESHDLSPSRLRRIEHLLTPDPARRPPMAAFHTLSWSRTRAPAGKIYLWLGGTPPRTCGATCDEVLTALGFPGQWPRLANAMHPEDVVSYLCLDLGEDPAARVKLYVQHRGRLSADRLARLDRLAPHRPAGDGPTLARLAEAAAARSGWPHGVPARTRLQWRSNSRRFWSCGTYLALVHHRPQPIDSVTHQFALTPHCRNDNESRTMIREVLTAYQAPESARAAYERCANAFAGPDPESQMYAHTYFSAQQTPDGPPRIAVYFNPRMFHSRHGLTNGDLDQARRFHHA
ncbi:hypothetical protein [Crossiella cryophila]|uniref:Aromatic prenyltransferase, DMATS type n=1 Tax=Crossiella cryophila TaxID=43355 RepID=A0A7W7CCG9_9PSEU|nr:hypothetical protein [Crossiella cryophila]MBB4678611.1 hypothetical protein [Crossiella cryophila]